MSQKEELIAIWSKAVETQMHFNEMSVRSRQLGLTFVTAALALSVVLISQGEEFSIDLVTACGKIKLHVAVLLVAASVFGLQAVKRLDLTVYHRMLRGAVAFGEDFEEVYMKQIFSLEKGMTQAISHYSRFDDANCEKKESGNYAYTGSKKITAGEKIDDFYKFVTISLIISAILLFVFTNISA